MARVKRGHVARKRRKKLLTRAKGFRGSLSTEFRAARQAVIKALRYSTRDRKNRKRTFRALWITRIGAAARANGTTYALLMSGLRKAGVVIDRKILSDLATRGEKSFQKLLELASPGNRK